MSLMEIACFNLYMSIVPVLKISRNRSKGKFQVNLNNFLVLESDVLQLYGILQSIHVPSANDNLLSSNIEQQLRVRGDSILLEQASIRQVWNNNQIAVTAIFAFERLFLNSRSFITESKYLRKLYREETKVKISFDCFPARFHSDLKIYWFNNRSIGDNFRLKITVMLFSRIVDSRQLNSTKIIKLCFSNLYFWNFHFQLKTITKKKPSTITRLQRLSPDIRHSILRTFSPTIPQLIKGEREKDAAKEAMTNEGCK